VIELVPPSAKRDPGQPGRLGLADFEELVARHRSRIYALALRMMRDPTDAEEVLQESVLSAWQNLADFRGDAAFGSWVYSICANNCLMRLRRRKIELNAAEAELLSGPRFGPRGELLDTPSHDWTRGTEEKALDNELRRAIERAAASLPPEHRAIFLLKDIDGLSYQEIGVALGTTVAVVKSRLHRARLAMRQAIDAFYAEPKLKLALAS